MKKTKTLLMALALGLGMNAYAEIVGPEGDWVVAFSPSGSDTDWEYYSLQDAYTFTTLSDDVTGKLKFNPDKGAQIPVQGDFALKGAKFEIQTNASQTVAFTQPLVNYSTSVTVTGQGTIETRGAAAFANVTVGNGTDEDTPTVKIASQIGVTNNFTVKRGGTLELESGSHLLLTQQIANEGTVKLDSGATLDASNLSHAAARDLGITFEGTDKTISQDGSGFLHGDAETSWSIATGGKVEVPEEQDDAPKLVVGSLSFDISKDGVVHHTETDYSVWFQNGGTSPALSAIILAAPDNKASVMANAGEDDQTEIVIDGQIRDENIVAVTRGTKAFINMSDNPPSEHSAYFAISNLKVYDLAEVTIHGWSGELNHVNNATFIGQGITLNTVEHPVGLGNEFDPMNLVVEKASSVTINADIVSPYGYFDGENFTNKCIAEDHPDIVPGAIYYRSGQYDLLGSLTIGEGCTIDMREASGTDYYTSATRDKSTKTVTNVVFQEEFIHLTTSEEGVLLLADGAAFLASTVSDDSQLITDGSNLDTTRKIGSAKYSEEQDSLGSWQYVIIDENGNKIDPDSLEKYTVNGTVEIRSLQDTGTAKITSIGEDTGHYTTRNANFTVANAEIIVNDQINAYESYEDGKINTIISNALIGDSVINEKANHGTVTLDNMKNQNFNTIHAKEGDIAITNREAFSVVIDDVPTKKLEDVSADTVWIGASKTVSATGTIDQEIKKATLNVDTLLRADGTNEAGYSKIDANLNLAGGATLDVSAANGTGGIDMKYNEVKFDIWSTEGSTRLTLSSQDETQAWALNPGGMYDLFHNVSAFDYGFGAAFPEEIEPGMLDASMYFTNFKEGWFYLCYSGADNKGGNGNNVGTIYLYSLVPEPTTGTLSLLALAALAARRRRK